MTRPAGHRPAGSPGAFGRPARCLADAMASASRHQPAVPRVFAFPIGYGRRSRPDGSVAVSSSLDAVGPDSARARERRNGARAGVDQVGVPFPVGWTPPADADGRGSPGPAGRSLDAVRAFVTPRCNRLPVAADARSGRQTTGAGAAFPLPSPAARVPGSPAFDCRPSAGRNLGVPGASGKPAPGVPTPTPGRARKNAPLSRLPGRLRDGPRPGAPPLDPRS